MPEKTLSIRIGTSNVVLPFNKTQFPPEFQSSSRLTYYASLFNTVEINSSFYKVPQFKTFARWAAEVPEDFRFTVKLWKEITHVKGLAFKEEDVVAFMQAAEGLGDKKGCLLVQFPGSVTVSLYSKVERLLELLHEIGGWQVVVEFRHNSWYIGEVYEMLDEFGFSVVLHDMKKSETWELNKKAKVVYVRFHGTEANYGGSYSDGELEKVRERILAWVDEGKEVYVYFNNTRGDGFGNARTISNCI
ncbi:DUF72 domain-containing protein [Filimonas effusa]|uniref:DUF72 domain-containing protein n=1 Tax=Filimonas effusa TaxID=2508721 RepID=A0A4Q1D591_9BACT|nr:DUF72 domain-containing protein [Filimonas effusa]RXK83645.1 DUF72 domain-containing protein [Filimonas effusa]